LQLIAKRSGDIFRLAAAVTNMEADEFDDLDMDDAVKVIMMIGKMNYDFFTKAVLPQVGSVVKAAAKQQAKTSSTK